MTEGLFETERIEIQRQNLEVVMAHHQDDEFTKYLQIKNVECARIRNYGPPRIDTLMQTFAECYCSRGRHREAQGHLCAT